jgi:hypothetical protein
MTGRRIAAVLVTVIGAAGFTVCLLALYTGARDVMQTDGGFCASGGPYVVAHQCSGADMRLMMVGILGGLFAVAIYAGGSSALRGRASSAGLLAWTALFGLLGWNFIQQTLHRAPGQGTPTGPLISGSLFLLMALGGFIPFLAALISDFRSGDRPDPAITGMQPLVQAAVTAGAPSGPGWQAGGTQGQPTGTGAWPMAAMPAPGVVPVYGPVTKRSTSGTGRLRIGAWLLASLAGMAVGFALSSSLITLLR